MSPCGRTPTPELTFIGVTGLLQGKDLSALGEVAANLDLIPKLQRTKRNSTNMRLAEFGPGRDRVSGRDRFIGGRGSAALRRGSACLHPYTPCASIPRPTVGSPDAGTRERDMTGLSRFVDNLPIPTFQNVPNGAALVAQGPTPYRTEETDKYSLSRGWLHGRDDAPYLQFWKSWWATMKNTLTANAP